MRTATTASATTTATMEIVMFIHEGKASIQKQTEKYSLEFILTWHARARLDAVQPIKCTQKCLHTENEQK